MIEPRPIVNTWKCLGCYSDLGEHPPQKCPRCGHGWFSQPTYDENDSQETISAN